MTRPGMTFQAEKSCKIELRNGVQMPILGLGTSHNGGYSHEAVVYALTTCNYRLIDTAKRYGCEEWIGVAIKESGVPRDELFLTTKLWPTDYGAPITRRAFFGSMRRLATDYIDLYMLHAPLCPSACADKRRLLEETWRELELLLDDGHVRAIGVSNFSIGHLEEMLEHCSVVPSVNQVEFHPYQNPYALRRFCEENGIVLEGHCPLAKGSILDEAPIRRIAERLGRTAAQVLIRWSIQNNVITIPKSTNLSRVMENCQVFDFALNDADMHVLNGLHDGRRIVDLSGFQDKIDIPMPDGYKLNLLQHQKARFRRTS